VAELDEHLGAELRALGRRLDYARSEPDPAAVAAAVRSRLEEPDQTRGRAPVRTRRRAWPRRLAIALVAVCAGAALVAFSPQVRDGITTLLRFAGVEIGRSTQPMPINTLPTTRPLPGERVVSLAEARRLAAFQVYAPTALGDPKRVLVADGTPPRVVSLEYAGPVRLDQFDGTLDIGYFKKVGSTGKLGWETVNGHTALWVEGPHAVGYVGRDGTLRLEEARLAANTLIWQVGGTTLRLEGDFTRAEALDLAESTK
jgi:hypothetical protein